MSACSQGAIRSFPLGLAITATDILYDSVSEPITMDIQWATRTTTPMFISPATNCITDEVGASNSNLTTLRFLNNNYTISAVQIITASHKAWILPNTAQSANLEDIVMTFSTTSTTTTYNYITFVIPIIRSANAADPNYFTGIVNPNGNGSYSLQSCFPADPRSRFARYVTCLAANTSGGSTQNVCVFVSINGIQANQTTMQAILNLTGRSGSFGTYSSPYTSRLTGTSTITTNADFSNKIQTTTQLLNYAGFKTLYPTADTNIREDDASAYQCVSVDPDKMIVDGKINVDLNSGELLTDVLDKRKHLRSDVPVSAGMEPGRMEKYLGTTLGIFLSIIIISILLYGLSIVFRFNVTGYGPEDFVGAPPEIADSMIAHNNILSTITDYSWYIVIILIALFFGFAGGIYMKL